FASNTLASALGEALDLYNLVKGFGVQAIEIIFTTTDIYLGCLALWAQVPSSRTAAMTAIQDQIAAARHWFWQTKVNLKNNFYNQIIIKYSGNQYRMGKTWF